jgi:hypothetical protein
MTTANEFEAIAREKKVQRLIMTLRAAVHLIDPRIRMEYLAQRVASYGAKEWQILELLTHEKRVSSDTSRAMVVAELQEAAQDEAAGQLQQRKGYELGEALTLSLSNPNQKTEQANDRSKPEAT